MRCSLVALWLLGALLTPSPVADEPLPAVATPVSDIATAAELEADATAAELEADATAAELEADALVLAQVATAEDQQAVAAVAWVVLNRAGCRVAPLRCDRTILETVIARRQFGTIRAGRWRASWRVDGPATDRALAEVRAVLAGQIPDPTRGATHFHRVGTWTPPWAPPARVWRVLGSHAFYTATRPAGTKKKTATLKKRVDRPRPEA